MGSSGATVEGAMLRRPKLCGDGATAGELRRLFFDDHVHVAVLVGQDGRLRTVVERSELDDVPDDAPAVTLGRLEGRTVAPGAVLEETRQAMLAAGRRRLAVIDPDGRLLGLLCLKRSGDGFCSDDGVAARAAERGRP